MNSLPIEYFQSLLKQKLDKKSLIHLLSVIEHLEKHISKEYILYELSNDKVVKGNFISCFIFTVINYENIEVKLKTFLRFYDLLDNNQLRHFIKIFNVESLQKQMHLIIDNLLIFKNFKCKINQEKLKLLYPFCDEKLLVYMFIKKNILLHDIFDHYRKQYDIETFLEYVSHDERLFFQVNDEIKTVQEQYKITEKMIYIAIENECLHILNVFVECIQIEENLEQFLEEVLNIIISKLTFSNKIFMYKNIIYIFDKNNYFFSKEMLERVIRDKLNQLDIPINYNESCQYLLDTLMFNTSNEFIEIESIIYL